MFGMDDVKRTIDKTESACTATPEYSKYRNQTDDRPMFFYVSWW